MLIPYFFEFMLALVLVSLLSACVTLPFIRKRALIDSWSDSATHAKRMSYRLALFAASFLLPCSINWVLTGLAIKYFEIPINTTYGLVIQLWLVCFPFIGAFFFYKLLLRQTQRENAKA
jgi:hypothetical protein